MRVPALADRDARRYGFYGVRGGMQKCLHQCGHARALQGV